MMQNLVWGNKGKIRYLVLIMSPVHPCVLSFFPVSVEPHLFCSFFYFLCLEWCLTYRKHLIVKSLVFKSIFYKAVTLMLFPDHEHGQN